MFSQNAGKRFDSMLSLKGLMIVSAIFLILMLNVCRKYVISEDMDALSWSIIMYSGIQYLVYDILD